jgi:hypothetical protein
MQTDGRRPRSPRRWLIALFAAASLVPWGVDAQSLTGALIATITDAHGGLVAGAGARLSSSALIGGSLETRTNERGQVRFPALPPGTYALEITMTGFTPVVLSKIEIGGGDALTRTLVLQPGVAVSIVVPGGATRLHERQPGFGTRFSADDLRTIPTRRSSMFDFIRMAPGISPTSPSSGTATTVSAFGSGINTNTFLIDGTNFTCPCIGIARSEPGIDFIQEVQVQSAGASAEFGNMQGAVVNVITRQGGDRFQFDGGSYGQTAALTSQPVRLQVPGSGGRETGYERVRYRDTAASVGGPIVRNRLWFFTGYQHLRDYDSQPGADAAQPRRYEQDKFVGKLTWRLAPGWTLFNSFHEESWVSPQQATFTRPYEATLRRSASVPATTFGHLTHTLSPNTVWDLRAGHFLYSEENRPSTGDLDAVSRFDAATRIQSGGPVLFSKPRLGRTTLKGTISHYRLGPWGADHDWRLGAQVEKGGHDVIVVTPTGERFVDLNGSPAQKIAQAPSRIGGEFVTAAAFVSDSIRVGDGLTVSAGLRFEHNRAYHQDLHGVDLAGNLTDEVFRGSGTLYTWNVLSPRLGVTKRLDADGRTILRASYGRYYQGVLTAELDFLHPGAAPIIRTNLVTGDVVVEDPQVMLRLDPDTRPPYTDEFSAGVDRQLGNGLTVAVAYVHKSGRNAIGWTDVAGVYRQEARTLADGTTVSVFALDTSVTPPTARRFVLTNQDDYSVDYRGLVVAVEKRRSRGWQAFGSYTFSRASGLQVFGLTTAGEQVSTIAPGGTWGRDPNDLTNAAGRLANDRPHVVRAMASVDVPRTGLLLAANLQHFSGKPWAATTVLGVPQSADQRILLEPRGSRRLSSQTLLDLRISRAIFTSRHGRVELLLDVLNALNDSAGEGLATDTLATLTTAHVPDFGRPNVFVDPRRAMLGVRISLGRP